ncbi:MAG: hypothetical protein FMNOHCHN_00868 [Ignavibacteriaceae bacterium]|nr:hypothetical protein [Ignavibacteriaceae bacterium]
MKNRFWIVLSVILLTSALAAQQGSEKLTPGMKARIADNSPGTSHLVWIYFTDKGDISVFKQGDYTPVSLKSLERRKKVTAPGTLPFDESDLPVNSLYISRLEQSGIQIKHISRWFNAVSAYATAAQLQYIQSLPFVKLADPVALLKKPARIQEDEPVSFLKQPDGVYVFNYGNSFAQLNQIKVPEVHNLGITGQGVTIAVMDAGFNRLSHESFNTMNIIAKWDFVNNDPGVGDSTDMGYGGHGTQTLSTIGGFKEGQLIGPAFSSAYILAKTENTDSETPIEEDNWIAAAEWADSIGADVFSTSLGYIGFDAPYPSYTWQSMDGNTARITIGADLAVKKGIVVLNSAGNEGFHSTQNTLGAPSDGDSVIAVGAVGSTGNRSSFSSVGNTVDGRTKPDIMARGSSVTVASTSSNTGYTTSSGTSFSCPLAAGVAALVLSANPTLTPMQVRDALRNTASNAAAPNREMGWGIVNALSAISYFVTPVEGWSMRASYISGRLNLEWQTTSESNNYGFEPEYSFDRLNWQSAGFVEGAGTTIQARVYNFSILLNTTASKIFVRIKQIDLGGSFRYMNEVEIDNILPAEFALLQNYPNPFNPSTRMKADIPEAGNLNIEIFTVTGERAMVLFNGTVAPGRFSADFTPADLPAGIYLARAVFQGVSGQKVSQTTKMTYLK